MTTTRPLPSSNPHDAPDPASSAKVRLPGILLGAGMGGFVDGIVLHQVLQWHHLLASTDSDNVGIDEVRVDTVAGLELNTLWDGLFHAATWAMVLAGLIVLSARTAAHGRAAWRPGALWGWMLVGWGLFNIVEGIVAHHVLAIHHVRAGPHQLWWDLAFLALGAALVAGGVLLLSSVRPRPRRPSPPVAHPSGGRGER